jgi:hypothetical protein
MDQPLIDCKRRAGWKKPCRVEDISFKKICLSGGMVYTFPRPGLSESDDTIQTRLDGITEQKGGSSVHLLDTSVHCQGVCTVILRIVGAVNPQCEDTRGKNPDNGITGIGCNLKHRVK